MSDVNPNFDSNAMPNSFFNIQQEYSDDKKLYDSLLTEGYNKYGVPSTFYVTDYNVNHDVIFGEDMDKHIIRKFNVMTYFELQPELEKFSNFGIEGLDNFSMWISKSHFKVASTYGTTGEGEFDSHVPMVGDILKTEFNDYWYEIINVNEQTEEFLQSKHSYELFVRVLRDEHLTVSPSLSGDEINDHENLDDIFDMTEDINTEKTDVLYDQSGSSDPLSEW